MTRIFKRSRAAADKNKNSGSWGKYGYEAPVRSHKITRGTNSRGVSYTKHHTNWNSGWGRTGWAARTKTKRNYRK